VYIVELADATDHCANIMPVRQLQTIIVLQLAALFRASTKAHSRPTSTTLHCSGHIHAYYT